MKRNNSDDDDQEEGEEEDGDGEEEDSFGRRISRTAQPPANVMGKRTTWPGSFFLDIEMGKRERENE